MNLDQAIKTLRGIKDTREKQKLDETSNAFAKSLNTFKNIIVGAMADLTTLILGNEPRVTIKNFPKIFKVEVQNKEPISFSDPTTSSRIDDLNKTNVLILRELKKMNKFLADKEKHHQEMEINKD